MGRVHRNGEIRNRDKGESRKPEQLNRIVKKKTDKTLIPTGNVIKCSAKRGRTYDTGVT